MIGAAEKLLTKPIMGARQEITAMNAPEDEAELIGCQPGDAILLIQRLYYDADGKFVEFTSSHFNPRRYSYRMDCGGGERERPARPIGSPPNPASVICRLLAQLRLALAPRVDQQAVVAPARRTPTCRTYEPLRDVCHVHVFDSPQPRASAHATPSYSQNSSAFSGRCLRRPSPSAHKWGASRRGKSDAGRE